MCTCRDFAGDCDTMLEKLKAWPNRLKSINLLDEFQKFQQDITEAFHTWARSYVLIVANLYLQGKTSTRLSEVALEKENKRTSSFVHYTITVLGIPAVKILNQRLEKFPKNKKSLPDISNDSEFWGAIESEGSKGVVRGLVFGMYEHITVSLSLIVDAGKEYKPDSILKHNFLRERVRDRKRLIVCVNEIYAENVKFSLLYREVKQKFPPGEQPGSSSNTTPPPDNEAESSEPGKPSSPSNQAESSSDDNDSEGSKQAPIKTNKDEQNPENTENSQAHKANKKEEHTSKPKKSSSPSKQAESSSDDNDSKESEQASTKADKREQDIKSKKSDKVQQTPGSPAEPLSEKEKLKKETERLSVNWNMYENFPYIFNFGKNFQENFPESCQFLMDKGVNCEKFPRQIHIMNFGVSKTEIMAILATRKSALLGWLSKFNKNEYPELFQYIEKIIKCIERTSKVEREASTDKKYMFDQIISDKGKSFEAPVSYKAGDIDPLSRAILFKAVGASIGAPGAKRMFKLKSLNNLLDADLAKIYRKLFGNFDVKELKFEDVLKFDPARKNMPNKGALNMTLNRLKRNIKSIYNKRFFVDSVQKCIDSIECIPEKQKLALKQDLNNEEKINTELLQQIIPSISAKYPQSLSDVILYYNIKNYPTQDNIQALVDSVKNIPNEQKQILKEELSNPDKLKDFTGNYLERYPAADAVIRHAVKELKMIDLTKCLQKSQKKTIGEKLSHPDEVDKLLRSVHNASKAISLDDSIKYYVRVDPSQPRPVSKATGKKEAAAQHVLDAKLERVVISTKQAKNGEDAEDMEVSKKVPKTLYRYINKQGIVWMLKEAGSTNIHLRILERYIENACKSPENVDFDKWKNSWIKECVEKLIPGTRIQHKHDHFCSTSTELIFKSNYSFGDIVLIITTADDTTGFYLGYTHEEFLLPKGQMFEITEVKKSTKKPKGAVLEIFVNAVGQGDYRFRSGKKQSE